MKFNVTEKTFLVVKLTKLKSLTIKIIKERSKYGIRDDPNNRTELQTTHLTRPK